MSAPVLSWLFTVPGKPEGVPCPAVLAMHASTIHREASSSRGSARSLEQGPRYPALRANPFPEVTDLFCRLPLPTLFYRPEAFHLGDLLRIWVRACTKITPSPSDFQGPTRAHRTPQEPWCFTRLRSLSPGEPIPGSLSLTKKRELFPGLAPASPSSFASPHLAP